MLSGCNVHNGGMAHRRFSCLNRKSACEQSLILFSVTLFSGRITLSMCKMFKLAKEEADELAELDCSNIITASKEAC